MNILLVVLTLGQSYALRLPPADLAKENPRFNVETDKSQHALPKLVDVMKVPDVLAALRKAHEDPGANASELEAWRDAQLAMFQKTVTLQGWKKQKGHYLYDQAFSTWFYSQMKDEPSFYTKSVFIPIPWQRIVEQGPRGLLGMAPAREWKCHQPVFSPSGNPCWGLQRAYEVLMSLDPALDYFTVMTQSHVGQVLSVGGDRFRRVPWEKILVFDSRGGDASLSQYPRIPIPLLHERDDFEQNDKPVQKQKKVFFAGSCSWSDARKDMGPGKAVPPGKLPNGTYAWEIHKCDAKVPHNTFRTKLRQSTWTITPTGTLPTSFMIYEALQAGSLIIFPWQDRAPDYGGGGPELSKFVWLPYRDIGVQWQHGIAEILEVSQLKSLKNMIENITEEDVARRQKLLKHVQPLFSQEGLNAYIIYMMRMVNRARSMMEDLTQEESSLGRAVDLVQWHTF